MAILSRFSAILYFAAIRLMFWLLAAEFLAIPAILGIVRLAIRDSVLLRRESPEGLKLNHLSPNRVSGHQNLRIAGLRRFVGNAQTLWKYLFLFLSRFARIALIRVANCWPSTWWHVYVLAVENVVKFWWTKSEPFPLKISKAKSPPTINHFLQSSHR